LSSFPYIKVLDTHTGGEPTRVVLEGGPELGFGSLGLELNNIARLTDYCSRVRHTVNDTGFPEIDHVQLFGAPTRPRASTRNFVLCPGKAYDRSPCGTGTSARLACLAADGKLAPGAEWVQEGVVGGTFRAKYRRQGDKIVPTITGAAHVIGEATVLIDPSDPFAWGIR
jgi:4-hydroxyproline epimerase